ncbi:caveolin-1-like [Clavelina lepadiformis]|uniref:caveolin-1-like n=1 Tax=Clavelina lepadiformis TaxID=159417 RepID=UPI004043153C
MADNTSDKKPEDFATQQEQEGQGESKDAFRQGSVTPQERHQEPEDRFSSENEIERAAPPQEDEESVKVPIDEIGMESVDLASETVEQPPTTEQPKKKRFNFKKKNTKRFGLDYGNRDPENLQQAVKVNFADIIAEPSGAHSFNTIWGTSYKVYSVTKFWIYRIMTVLFGVPCALFWGIYFSCLAFLSIWWIMPCIRAIAIKMNFVSKLWSIAIRTFLDPVFESFGLILSRIRVMLTLRRD